MAIRILKLIKWKCNKGFQSISRLGKDSRKGLRCEGKGNEEVRQGNEGKGRPQEGLSAIFEADGTYKDDIQREWVARSCVIHWRIMFCSGL